jgi:uncharacterized protein
VSARLEERLHAVDALLRELAPVRIAVSGGVDSMTLALLAGRTLGERAEMVHAVSPAVPAEATARVRATGTAEGWRVRVIDAGEFGDEAYLANPYDRCFHCKTHLYGALASLGAAAILSGTNADDLEDYRPGLLAARAFGVRHPFVECGIDKASVRAICSRLGRNDIATLPAAPCLSSRVETGLRIQATALAFVHAVESALRDGLQPGVVRCRVRPQGITVEVDRVTLERLHDGEGQRWRERVALLARERGMSGDIHFELYRRGSAFVAGR